MFIINSYFNGLLDAHSEWLLSYREIDLDDE